jgi:LysM repeat protein
MFASKFASSSLSLAALLSALVAAPTAASASKGGEPEEAEGDPAEALTKSKASSKSKSKSKSKKSKKRTRNAEACDFRTPIFWHEVEAGEHLGLIAGRYGVMSKDLIALNPSLADNPDHIRVGQKLAICPEIPPVEIVEHEYIVAKGDTFNQIALDHELAPEELLAQQDGRLGDPGRLRVGDKLRIVEVGGIVPGFEPEPPQKGKLVHSRKLPTHEAYTIKRPHLAYGTPLAIKLIGQVVERYTKKAKGGPKIRIGDISKQGGGPLTGHLSHQEGNDIDVGLVLKGKLADRLYFSGATPKNLDARRTWLLIEEFIATGEVRVIFLDYQMQKVLYEWAKSHGVSEKKLDEYLQYPRGIGRHHGIIRHWRGHVNHFHVRFRS